MCDMCKFPAVPLEGFKFDPLRSWVVNPLWFWAIV